METPAARSATANSPPLQWGHRLSAMETSQEWVSAFTAYMASMGPPPFGDGNPLRRGGKRHGDHASMGPPPFGDGNPLRRGGKRHGDHASMGPPPFGDGNCESTLPGLQHHAASMGPPPFGDGNRYPQEVARAVQAASMGPPPFGDGNRYLCLDSDSRSECIAVFARIISESATASS